MSQYPQRLFGALVQSFVCKITYYMHTPKHMSGTVLTYSAQFFGIEATFFSSLGLGKLG